MRSGFIRLRLLVLVSELEEKALSQGTEEA
jgi:hypothetical protein